MNFAYEALKWTTTNQIAQNWTMWNQAKTCITKLSCEICTLLRYYIMQRKMVIPY